jgi:hypothetical protein
MLERLPTQRGVVLGVGDAGVAEEVLEPAAVSGAACASRRTAERRARVCGVPGAVEASPQRGASKQ